MTNSEKILHHIRHRLTYLDLIDFDAEADRLLWIEARILDPLDLPGVATSKGYALAEIAEEILDKDLNRWRLQNDWAAGLTGRTEPHITF